MKPARLGLRFYFHMQPEVTLAKLPNFRVLVLGINAHLLGLNQGLNEAVYPERLVVCPACRRHLMNTRYK